MEVKKIKKQQMKQVKMILQTKNNNSYMIGDKKKRILTDVTIFKLILKNPNADIWSESQTDI